ncbi:MAG: radical SAM protein [Candidatus Auribacterota bacterium]|nr:radical SAM protein [Candidatus Auribacterota bacterium]
MHNNANTHEKYIFGPVPSRRLGRSLGIDLVPYKTCTYDCIYCQLGKTTHKTVERKEWVPLERVVNQLKEKIELQPDYITLSGSGEPSLYSLLNELISSIKKITAIPVAVLTNGSLLWLPEVRDSLQSADLVIPSLDAGSDEVFQYINRPHPFITFDRMLQGLIELHKKYKGAYWLEVFLLNGVNTTSAEIDRLSECINSIQPDKVQVNTITRPPANAFAQAVPKQLIHELTKKLSKNAEVIADYKDIFEQPNFSFKRDDVLNLLMRRPCTVDDISNGLGIHRNETLKYLSDLLLSRKIYSSEQSGTTYYMTK